MKYLKGFNENKISTLRKCKFINMSWIFKVSVVIRAYEVNENVDWSLFKDHIDL